MFHIIIRSNVTVESISDMNEFVNFFYDMVGNDERFSFFFRPAGDWGGENRINEINRIQDKDICEVYKNLVNADKNLSINIYNGFYKNGGCMCYACFKDMYVIDSQGGIRKCTCGLDNPDYCIGYIKENGNMDINQSKHAKWIGNTTRFSEKCSNCRFLPICFGASCPRSNILEYQGEDSIRCPSEFEYILDTLKLIERNNSAAII